MARYKEIFRELKKIRSARVLRDEPLSRHTTFRIGGPADIFVIPKDLLSLKEVLSVTQGIKKYIMGNGSNLLLPDKGIRGIVIKVSGGLNDFECDGRHVTVGAGTLVQPLIHKLAGLSLSGLEFAAGVPAALGGSIVMNMGAFGHDISGLIEHVEMISGSGRKIKLSRSELGFSYRSSRIDECIVTSAKLKLSHKSKEIIKRNIEQIIIKRKETQPWAVPSAGSIFKNPKEIQAGKLIDMAGLKGLRVGGAEISKKHANFIINLGDAKETDIKSIIRKVKAVIKDKFRVKLDLELVDSTNLIMLS